MRPVSSLPRLPVLRSFEERCATRNGAARLFSMVVQSAFKRVCCFPSSNSCQIRVNILQPPLFPQSCWADSTELPDVICGLTAHDVGRVLDSSSRPQLGAVDPALLRRDVAPEEASRPRVQGHAHDPCSRLKQTANRNRQSKKRANARTNRTQS